MVAGKRSATQRLTFLVVFLREILREIFSPAGSGGAVLQRPGARYLVDRFAAAYGTGMDVYLYSCGLQAICLSDAVYL